MLFTDLPNILDRSLENDASLQSHIESQSPKANIARPVQNLALFNVAMSKHEQSRPQAPAVVIGTTKLNQGTPTSASGTAAAVNTSNVIQTNNKNTMLSSFVSVIEGTKDLSISDEKQRSPKHQHRALSPQRQQSSKGMSNLPKQHPLLENTNLNSIQAKLPAAPTVITPKPFEPAIKSGNLK